MQIYLVGGAVRDRLLGLPIKDRDYVVVGATPEQLVAQGYKPVGKDFPVFLHPETGEAHALARTERKSGRGYHGFTFYAAQDVTLEQDLIRRDLTINAIAEDPQGNIVDPFGGRRDIEARILRHVSPAFAEDPLRILRVARFLARYQPLGFTIAEETLQLMRRMVDEGEAAHLVDERVWQETRLALQARKPGAYLRVLRQTGALAVLFPELDGLYGVPQRAEYHPEIDTGIHQEMVSDMAAALAPGDALVGFCALTHDLGKGSTPAADWPRHIGHEHAGTPLVEALCARLNPPAEYKQMALLVCELHLQCHRAFELRAATVLAILEKLDAFRKPDRLNAFLLACEADKRGRAGLQDSDYPQAHYLARCHAVARQITAAPFLAQGLSGEALGRAIKQARMQAIADCRKEHEG